MVSLASLQAFPLSFFYQIPAGMTMAPPITTGGSGDIWRSFSSIPRRRARRAESSSALDLALAELIRGSVFQQALWALKSPRGDPNSLFP